MIYKKGNYIRKLYTIICLLQLFHCQRKADLKRIISLFCHRLRDRQRKQRHVNKKTKKHTQKKKLRQDIRKQLTEISYLVVSKSQIPALIMKNASAAFAIPEKSHQFKNP